MFFKTEFLHSTNWKLNYNSKHFSKFLEFQNILVISMLINFSNSGMYFI